MSNGATTIEDERLMQLQETRNSENQNQPDNPTVGTLSFGQKISQHRLILGAAVFFDFLGIIPLVCVVTNFLFGLVLFFYFGGKSGKEKQLIGKVAGGMSVRSEFIKIGLPTLGASIIDSLLSFLPACVGVALLRIYLS